MVQFVFGTEQEAVTVVHGYTKVTSISVKIYILPQLI